MTHSRAWHRSNARTSSSALLKALSAAVLEARRIHAVLDDPRLALLACTYVVNLSIFALETPSLYVYKQTSSASLHLAQGCAPVHLVFLTLHRWHALPTRTLLHDAGSTL